MITIPSGDLVLLATRPVDFRKGAHGLAALTTAMLGEDPFSGVVVVFRAKRADRVKIIARQSRWESATIKVGKSLLARGVGRAEPDRRREQAEAWPDVPPGGRRAW